MIARRPREALREDGAQATVELAVTAPVLIVLAIAVANLMVYACAVARFDRVAPDVVLACGQAPAGQGGRAGAAELVESELAAAMEGYPVEVGVERSGGSSASGAAFELVGGLETLTCSMEFEPWPGPLSIAGVELGAPVSLEHERALTFDPWRSGVVV